ncbi:MAG: hypothetical protein AMS23_01570 [Bacteroides sp. SM1_62]|nr:MAG: hypothetical protein AMS23_01570 [Bacteroides sp. SM1_62]
MSYIHKGFVQDNGMIDHGTIITDPSALAIRPEDDGLHIVDYTVGDFEWWYFDVVDHTSGIYLKIVIHLGTDPLRMRIYPQLAISLNTPDMSGSFSQPYSINDLDIYTHQCNISIKDDVRVRTASGIPLEYTIVIDIPVFQCNLTFVSDLEGWKPLGNGVTNQIGKKKGVFSWTIQSPKARVEGEFTYKDKKVTLQNTIGYHDHNYIKVDRRNPLYLDELVTRWYWGKCYAENHTVIFMDTHCRTNRILSLMVAEENRIIHSSNNMIDCLITHANYDHSLGVEYPASLMVTSKDENLPMQMVVATDRILDSKDLLEGVNPVLKWLIKKLVAKPVYHGLLSKVSIRLKNKSWEGFGNFEAMVFRTK